MENTFTYGASCKTSCVLTQKEDLETLTTVHKKLAESTGDKNGNYTCVYYVLKDGSTFSRTFYVNSESASFETLSIRDTNAFKDELTYLMSSEQKDSDTESELESYIKKLQTTIQTV
ncbi:MAG: hypothetical protein LUG95_02820 [Clostridiales bacterium]|nr:hypothetical protein [Clostridiales bacterium]